MSERQKSKNKNKAGKPQPTIGLLTGLLNESSWAGVADMAREQDVNLICFSGGMLDAPTEFQDQANILFDLVDVEQLDGLIIWSGIGKFVDAEKLAAFYQRYQSIPLVSIGQTVADIPSVVADNYGGMYQAVAHLVEDHGFHRIAYIKGHEDFPEHEERYRAYCDALNKYGLAQDPNLVVSELDTGKPHYSREIGRQAIKILLDDRQAKFEALVVNDDIVAYGIIDELQSRGSHVPNDVPIIGFADDAESQYITPPLSTVPYPYYEIGRQAVEMLLAQLAGNDSPARMHVPTRLVVRQSCGCLDPAIEQITGAAMPGLMKEFSSETQQSAGQKIIEVLAKHEADILAEVEQTIELSLSGYEGHPINPVWFAQLLDTFGAELSGAPGTFLRQLDVILRQVVASGGDVMVWQNAISEFRKQILPYLDDEEILLRRAEDLWQQARVMMGDFVKRVEGQKSLQVERQSRLINKLGRDLINMTDIPAIMDTLAQSLPQLGIERCYLSLYEDPAQPLAEARLLLAYDKRGQRRLKETERIFPTRQLAPQAIFRRQKTYSLVVEALYFREDQQGFVLFEADNGSGELYHILRDQISSALQSALLIKKREKAEQALAQERELLQALMDTSADVVYFKDLESRFIRISKRHAEIFNLDDPKEALGKTDFDFFGAEHAQQAYQDEQRIIKTGEPIIDLEEKETWPDGHVTWASTTKMPLRDENGTIVGTFGISRDITARKESDAIISKRAAELELVAQVSIAALNILDTKALLQTVVNLTKENFGLYHAHIYLLDEITGELVLAAGAGTVGQKMVAQGWAIPLDREQSLVARAARSGSGVIVNNVREEPGWLPNKDLPHTCSELAVPLLIGDRVLGVLDVQSDEVDHFTADDIRIQTTLAAQVAVALENARLFEQSERTDLLLRERVKELDCLNDIGREMEENPPPLPELLEWITQRIPPAMQFPDLAVAAIEFDGRVYGQPEAIDLPAQIVHGLYIGSQILGRIYISYTEKRDFIDEESALLGGIATRVSGFIENQRLLEQTEQRSQEMESILAEVRQLAAIVENHPDFIGVGNMDGHALYVNPAGLKLMGLPLNHDVTVMAASDFFTADDAERFIEEGVPTAIEVGSWTANANLLRADGHTVPVEVTVSINYDIEGNPSTLSVTMHDITNRQVAEIEQARLLAEVEASYRQYVRQEWEQYLQEQHQGQWHIEHQQVGSVVSADLTRLQEEVMRERATRTVSHRPGNGAEGGTVSEPAAMVTPLSLRGQVIGTLNLQDTVPDRNWSDEEIALVEAVSEQLALTVENLRLFDDTQRRATREQVTRQITDKMHAASDVDAIIQTGLTELAKALGVSRTYVKLNPAKETNQSAQPVSSAQQNVEFDIDEETNP